MREMLEGKIVRVRLRRNVAEQRVWVYVGEVTAFTENWVMIKGKSLSVLKRAQVEVEIEEEPRGIVIPRDNIAVIRLLPDDFDMENIQWVRLGHKVCLLVHGTPDATIADITEI